MISQLKRAKFRLKHHKHNQVYSNNLHNLKRKKKFLSNQYHLGNLSLAKQLTHSKSQNNLVLNSHSLQGHLVNQLHLRSQGHLVNRSHLKSQECLVNQLLLKNSGCLVSQFLLKNRECLVNQLLLKNKDIFRNQSHREDCLASSQNLYHLFKRTCLPAYLAKQHLLNKQNPQYLVM